MEKARGRSRHSMKAATCAALATLATLDSLAAGLAGFPAKVLQPEQAVVRLEPYAGRLVTVSVRMGGEPMRLLLDTGGGQTLITPAAAARIGCRPTGRSVGFRMSGEKVEFALCPIDGFSLGARHIAQPSIAVWDLMSILPKELPAIDGVLALDAFAGIPFTLQLAARTLTLEDDASLARRIASMTRVPIRIATGTAGADITIFLRAIGPRPGWLLLDSANLGEIVLAPHMTETPTPHQNLLLALDGLPARRVTVEVRPLIYDGALSEAFMRDWVWTFRLGTGDAWAGPVESIAKQKPLL